MSILLVKPDGQAAWQNRTFQCALGRNGVTSNKVEGDGATPVGSFPIRKVWYRADRVTLPEMVFPARAIEQDDGWCDDTTKSEYNRHVKLPFDGSYENLWRDDETYDIVVQLGHNDTPIMPGKGSAIFMHIARPDFSPTEGCVALTREDLLSFLRGAPADTLVAVMES